MFTTGSKLLIGGSVFATVAALVYGISQNEALGVVGLISAALALAVLAGFNVWARDSNLSATDTTVIATSDAATNPPGASIWPMVFALGGAVLVVGLITQQTVFTVGIIIIIAAGAQWMVQDWAEAAAGDRAVAAKVRSRIANPLEYALLGVVSVGLIAVAFSRVMLWLSKTNTVITFAVLAMVIACIGFFFAFRPSIKRGAIGGALGIGAVVIVASGVAAGVDGERDIHVHETTGDDAAYVCDSAEKFEADKNASQTVATKASTYTITLTESGELTYDVPGPLVTGSDVMDLPRSNPNNIVFRNDSDEERRLTLDLGLATVEEEAEDEEASGHGGEEGLETLKGESVEKSDRLLQCTTLLEPGGAQLLTVKIDVPSIDPEIADAGGYRFYVPGTDAELGLYVP
jgi:hypothetical protein